MRMFIHSSFGVLECTPMTLQAIEKSIPEGTLDNNESTENSLYVSDGNTEDNTEETDF